MKISQVDVILIKNQQFKAKFMIFRSWQFPKVK